MIKKLSLLTILTSIISTNSFAKDIDIYYMPTCPHCHHALEFLENDLKKELSFELDKINVSEPENRDAFIKTAKKCDLKSYGVPVIVINDKCIQGFGESTKNKMRDELKLALAKKTEQIAKTNDSNTPEIKNTENTESIAENIENQEINTQIHSSSFSKILLLCGCLAICYFAIYFYRKNKIK